MKKVKKRRSPFAPVSILLLIGGITVFVLHNAPPAAGHTSGHSGFYPDPEWEEIIYYGSLAPNSHNAQMWKVKIRSGQGFILALDQAHLLPEVDPENREALISLGAFLENVVTISPKFGFQADVEIIAGSKQDEEVARVTLVKNKDEASKETVLVQEGLIKARHTLRKPYKKEELSAPDLSALKSVFSLPGSSFYYFPLSSPEGTYIADAIVASMAKQVASDAKQSEFAKYTRFSKKEARELKDGITPEMMGLSGIKKWFVSTFFNQDTVMSASFRQQTVKTTKEQAFNCAGFFLICSPDGTVESLINTGRLLQRFWLTATAKKIAVHPMSSVLEESPWQEELGAKLGINEKIQMVLRVGYVKDYAGPFSRRRPVPVITD